MFSIQAQSVKYKDNEVLQGSPAFDTMITVNMYVHFKNLPKLVAEIEELKNKYKTKKNGNNG
jgi:UDP-3-O-[3-hydroxymyristoyl] glucosamine N-acyltransferase